MNTTESKIAAVQARISVLVMVVYQLKQVQNSYHCTDKLEASAEIAALIQVAGDRQIRARFELDELNEQLAREVKATKRDQAARRPAVKAAIAAAFKSDECKWKCLTLKQITEAAALQACDEEEVKAALNQLVRDDTLNAFSRKYRASRHHDAQTIRHWELSRKSLIELGMITE